MGGPQRPAGPPGEGDLGRAPDAAPHLRRLNPVGLLLAGDVLAAVVAAWVWRALWPGAAGAPMASPGLGWIAPVLAVAALAAAGAYRHGRPGVPRALSPALWLGMAPAVAAPAEAGPGAGLLVPALWLAALTALLVTAGRLVLAAARPGPLGRLCAPRAVVLASSGLDCPGLNGSGLHGPGLDCPASNGPGAGDLGALLARLAEPPRLLGRIGAPDAADDAGGRTGGLPWLGPVAALPALVAAGRLDLAVVADPLRADLPALSRLGLRLVAVADLADGPRLVPLGRPPLSDGAAVAKRLFDIVAATLGLLLLAPLMAAVAVAVRLDSPGPAVFRQVRAGLHGRTFALLKFRTMRADAADPAGAVQTGRDDPRLTRLGRVLRATSLDELPQLVNVLRGEMSLIGPRPHALGTRAGGAAFESLHPHYPTRHRLRPGLTGLAQVRGQRGALDSAQMLVARTESDLDYVAGWSLRRDIAILARTAWVVLRMRNAW